jgi:hypothetical protein
MAKQLGKAGQSRQAKDGSIRGLPGESPGTSGSRNDWKSYFGSYQAASGRVFHGPANLTKLARLRGYLAR